MALYGKLGKKAGVKSLGIKKKLGKGTTAKAKSGSMKMRPDKKAKKSKSMYA